MSLKTYSLCVLFSLVLMILFVLVNFPYYRNCYGKKSLQILLRTIGLNAIAICIGWAPVVYFWPKFSIKFLLPCACILGALGCVASRFIYRELVPEELAKKILEVIKAESSGTPR